jgi:hypothetical protein
VYNHLKFAGRDEVVILTEGTPLNVPLWERGIQGGFFKKEVAL